MTDTQKINFSEQVELGDLTEEGSEGDLQASPTKGVVVHKNDRSLSELHRWEREGILNLNPDWQRNFVWDPRRSSKLIESILMDLPIPVIYLSQTDESTYEVIDGVQRLTSIFEFFDNNFALTGMQSRQDLQGKKFQDLDKSAQNKLKNSTLRTFELAENTDKNILFIIFERLNTGGIALNEMEIRNCIYSGPLNNRIKELVKNPDFNTAIKGGRLSQRMADSALILRFLAFRHSNYKDCKNLKKFLNDFMENYRFAKDAKLNEFEQSFKLSMKACKTVFGENAFRLRNENKGGWSQKINASIFQVIAVSLSYYDTHQITMRADAIYEEYLDMLANDAQWIDAVTRATANSEKIRYAFEAWQKRLDIIMTSAQPRDKVRLFSKQLKIDMFKSNNTCADCTGEIKTVDDAQLDHEIHYWRGGKTVPENARLLHRICNQKRSHAA